MYKLGITQHKNKQTLNTTKIKHQEDKSEQGHKQSILSKLFTLTMEDIFKNVPWNNRKHNINGESLKHLKYPMMWD